MKKLLLICLLFIFVLGLRPPLTAQAFAGERNVTINFHNQTKGFTIGPTYAMEAVHGTILWSDRLQIIKPGESTHMNVRENIFSFIGPEGWFQFKLHDGYSSVKDAVFNFNWHHPYGSGQSSYWVDIRKEGAFKNRFEVIVDQPHAVGHTPTINVYIRDK